MESKRIGGHDAPDFDEQVAVWLDAQEPDPWGGGPTKMMIGIRNDAGDIYRGIRCDDLIDYVSACQFLKGLGLRDEREGLFGMSEKCDSIFARIA